MATPTLVSGLTDWQTMEGVLTFTSIGGGAGGSVSTEFFKQGSQSAGRKAASTGRYGFAINATATDFTVAGRYLWIWWCILYSPNLLTTRAGGGVAILLGTGGVTNYYEYYVGGNDFSPDGTPVVAGKWYRSVIDVNNATVSSTGGSGATKTSIDRVGITVNYTSTPSGNLNHFYVDGAQYGSGYQFTGGTSIDPVKLSDISAYTETNARAWGIMQAEQGVYFTNGKLTVGNGATTTYLTDNGQVLLYRPQEYYNGSAAASVLTTEGINGILTTGSGANLNITNSLIKTVNNYNAERWTFDSSSPNALILSGNTFTKSSAFNLYAGQDCQTCVFDNCDQIVPSTATYKFNTIKNYVGTEGGAVLFPTSTSNINNLSFINNVYGVEFSVAGSAYAFSNNSFSGSTTADSNNSVASTSVDSYSETNQNATQALTTGATTRAAQSFTGTSGVLSNAKFYLNRNGTTGNAVAKLYSDSAGSPGTVLATSNTVALSTLSASPTYALAAFEFEDKYTILAATTYWISIEYTDASTLNVGVDNTPAHSGAMKTYNGTWNTSTNDMCFYVYKDGIVEVASTNTSYTGGSIPNAVQTNTNPGATIITSSVDVDIHVQDQDQADVYLAQVAVYDSNNVELLNTDTDINGDVGFSFTGSTPAPVIIKVRKSSSGDTRYIPVSIPATITSTGLTQTITLREDTIVAG